MPGVGQVGWKDLRTGEGETRVEGFSGRRCWAWRLQGSSAVSFLLPEAEFQVAKPTEGEGESLAFAHGPACRVAVEVVTTMTSADVMWQDGSVECNIRSNDLFPVHHLDNNEFCPGDFVVDKRGTARRGSGGRVMRSGSRPPLGGGSSF